MNAESVASGLEKPRRLGTGRYIACCPAHDDKRPSLSIADKNGNTLVYCFSGCHQDEVIGALRDRGLWPMKKGRQNPSELTQAQIDEMGSYVLIFENKFATGYEPSDEEFDKWKKYRAILHRHGLYL